MRDGRRTPGCRGHRRRHSYYPDGDTHTMADGSGTTTDYYNHRSLLD
ncbi:MAG TPA: hypothetical protein VFB34_14210 [Chloroflexota bacterium]|nr:hypothetical protein [Chloroflexota bacterium]